MTIFNQSEYFLRQKSMLTYIHAEPILNSKHSNAVVVVDSHDLIRGHLVSDKPQRGYYHVDEPVGVGQGWGYDQVQGLQCWQSPTYDLAVFADSEQKGAGSLTRDRIVVSQRVWSYLGSQFYHGIIILIDRI